MVSKSARPSRRLDRGSHPRRACRPSVLLGCAGVPYPTPVIGDEPIGNRDTHTAAEMFELRDHR